MDENRMVRLDGKRTDPTRQEAILLMNDKLYISH